MRRAFCFERLLTAIIFGSVPSFEVFGFDATGSSRRTGRCQFARPQPVNLFLCRRD